MEHNKRSDSNRQESLYHPPKPAKRRIRTSSVSLAHLKRAVCFALVFVLLLPMLPSNLSLAVAEGSDHVVTWGNDQKQGFVKFSEAWDFANSKNGTIDMHADAFLGRRLTLSEGHNVTINMNGYMINRGKTDPDKIKTVHDSGGDGTIFYLEKNAKLTINGGTDEASKARTHKGRLISDVWYYDNKGSTVFNGALITGSGSDSHECAAINMGDHAELTIKDVNIAGNVSDTYGIFGGFTGGHGAVIKLLCPFSNPNSSNATVHLENCTIYNNFARKNGTVIRVEDHENAKIELIGCKIASNVTEGDGGVILVDEHSKGASITLTKTWIHDNTAKNGAAIYIEAEGCTIEGGKFEFNHARENGAAIYLYGVENTVRGATIHKNDAKEKGGGVFIYQEDCTLSGCTITENTAGTNGGGVFLNSNNKLYVPKTHLSGTLIVKDNTVGGKKNNIYLENPYMYRAALIMGVPDIDSEIWVTYEDTTGVITYIPDSYNDTVFHSDNSDYKVYWGQNKSKSDEYRHLVIGKGTSQGISLPGIDLKPGVSYKANDDYTADFTYTGINKLEPTEYTYMGWPVYKGYGREDSATSINAYYYSDSYFQIDATVYDQHLASLSLRLAAAGFNSGVWADTTGTGWEYKLQSAHVKQMLSDIGVADEDIYLSDSYFVKPETDSIGCAIGSKKLLDADGNDKGLVLVPIVVRGAGYEKEWASNVTLGLSGLHQGFNEAATKVVDTYLADYLEQHPQINEKLEEGKVRFWVVGFSRAGATANLVSKKLIDKYQNYKNNHNVIYGYTFEAPQGGIASEKQEGSDYTTIHNTILPGDLVPNVAMVAMGFQRFGVDHYLPGGNASPTPISFSKRYYNELSTGKKNQAVFLKDNDAFKVGSASYEEMKTIMLRQLAATNHNRVFDDYFHLATVKIDSIYERQIWHEIGTGNVTMEDWISDLTYYLNEWLVDGERNDARKFYVENEQATLRRILELMMGTDKLNLDRALDRAKSFSFIYHAVSILLSNAGTAGTSLSNISPRMLNLCFDEKIFADDAIPVTREQGKELIDIVSRLLWGDLTFLGNYSKGTSVTYEGVSGFEYLIMIPTLIYNKDRILLNHMPDVVFAWLRSKDTFYKVNDDHVSDYYFVGLQAEKSKVEKPYLTYELNGDGEKRTLMAGEELTMLDTDKLTYLALCNAEKNQGGLIFYDMAFGEGKPEKADKYYSGTTVFEKKNNEIKITGGSAVITAKTIWHDTPSEDAVFNIIVKKDTHHKVYILKRGEKESNLESGYDFYCVAEEGDSFTINMHPEEGWIITSWYYYIPNHGVPIYGNIDNIAQSVSEDETTLQIKMPGSDILRGERDLYLIPSWRQRAVYVPVFSITPGEYNHDIWVEVYTPAGTEEEGFYIKYKMESHSPDYDSEYGAGDYTYPLTLFGSENGPVTWKLTAQAFHEGWLPSSEVTVEYTINYRNRVFIVDVIGGTLTDTGKSYGTFHLGDVVHVTALEPEGSTFSVWSVSSSSDTVNIDNVHAADTSFTMPYHDVTVAASFEVLDVPTPIYVEDGEAYNESGEKITEALPGQCVYLLARDPQTDGNGDKTERFTSWTGPEFVSFADASNERTTFIMPLLGYPENGVHLKANFQKMYKVTVDNGTATNAAGNAVTHAAEGERITISPDTADNQERVFSTWDFDTVPVGVADLTQRNLSFDMPNHDVMATAKFQYTIKVMHGHAEDAQGQTITAAFPGEKVILVPDAPPEGMLFDHWKVSRGLKPDDSTETELLELIMPESAVTAEAMYSEIPDVPQTGDNNTPALWMLLGIASVLGLINLQSKGRKKETH